MTLKENIKSMLGWYDYSNVISVVSDLMNDDQFIDKTSQEYINAIKQLKQAQKNLERIELTALSKLD